MADPTTIGEIGLGASAAGTGTSVIGSLFGGQATSQMYGYQAGMAEFRRKIALQNRDYALQTGEEEAFRYGLKSRFEAGRIAAGQGASGIDVGTGSTVDVRRGQKFVSDLDMATIRNNAARKAYGFEVEAAADAATADMFRAAGRNARTSGYLNAFGNLIAGAGSVSSKWLQGQSAGLWGGGGMEGYSGFGGRGLGA